MLNKYMILAMMIVVGLLEWHSNKILFFVDIFLIVCVLAYDYYRKLQK